MDNNVMFQKSGVLIELETELFERTKIVYSYLTELEYSKRFLYELELSKIYSLYVALKTYMLVNEDISHYEISSLLTYWNEMFIEMESVVSDAEGKNTSWLFGRYEKYLYQHEVVDRMVRDFYNSWKATLVEN